MLHLGKLAHGRGDSGHQRPRRGEQEDAADGEANKGQDDRQRRHARRARWQSQHEAVAVAARGLLVVAHSEIDFCVKLYEELLERYGRSSHSHFKVARKTANRREKK